MYQEKTYKLWLRIEGLYYVKKPTTEIQILQKTKHLEQENF